MSSTDKPLGEHTFRFDGHELHLRCRRLPEEVARVTQTLQLDVDQLWASLLDWGGPPPSAGDGGEPQGQPNSKQPNSKQLCGNVADDQPDLIGLDVWPAAIALCEYLARRPQLVAGAAVCELGAGMGLPGSLCAKLGAASVLLTDYEPVVVDHMRHNAEQNGVSHLCSFLALDWFDLAPLSPHHRQAFHLILLADVIYAAAVVQPLVETLQALLRPDSGVALVAHRIRRPLIFDSVDRIAKLQERDEIFEEFKAACQSAGLHLRFLSDGHAAMSGEEPLLLVIGYNQHQLQRFPLLYQLGTAARGKSSGGRGNSSLLAAAVATAAGRDGGDASL